MLDQTSTWVNRHSSTVAPAAIRAASGPCATPKEQNFSYHQWTKLSLASLKILHITNQTVYNSQNIQFIQNMLMQPSVYSSNYKISSFSSYFFHRQQGLQTNTSFDKHDNTGRIYISIYFFIYIYIYIFNRGPSLSDKYWLECSLKMTKKGRRKFKNCSSSKNELN